MSEFPEKVPRKKIAPWRVAVASVIVLVLALGSLGYHDGAFGTTALADAQDLGTYRFKGEITDYDASLESFLLRDGTSERRLQWNITSPQTGVHYVVDAELVEGGTLRALALSRVFVFEGSWT